MSCEHDLVKAYYGDRRAERSGVPLINHIDEGLVILEALGADRDTGRAWCLHPLFQDDCELTRRMARVATGFGPVDCDDTIWRCEARVIALVMEYRNQANAWLSDKVTFDRFSTTPDEPICAGEPTAGPLLEVRQMLIADKVQNRRDFERFHKDTHPRSRELDHYFITWLEVLGISDSQYDDLLVTIAEAGSGR